MTWLTTYRLHQIDNAIQPRSVVGLSMDANENLRLLLSGGGWLWYPTGTVLATALNDAQDRGFLVTEIKASEPEPLWFCCVQCGALITPTQRDLSRARAENAKAACKGCVTAECTARRLQTEAL